MFLERAVEVCVGWDPSTIYIDGVDGDWRRASWSGHCSEADGGPWAGLGWMGSVIVGGFTAVMDSSLLQRRPDESAVIEVRQRILFHEVPGGMLVNRIAWEVGLERWGLVGVH